MKTVAIIQARTGSSRLPNKVLADIGGRSMLARVVRRAQRARGLDEVVVATTLRKADDRIVDACQSLGVTAFRGSEHDVLDRYYRAARSARAEVVVRICSDCPLIDPQVVDQVVQEFSREGPDYASNFLDRTFPRGLETEVLSFRALEQAFQHAQEAYQRTHVTPYVYQHPESFRLLSVRYEPAASGPLVGERDGAHRHHRWTVDTREDLELVRALYARLGNDDVFGWRQVVSILAEEPELAMINRHIQQKALEEG